MNKDNRHIPYGYKPSAPDLIPEDCENAKSNRV